MTTTVTRVGRLASSEPDGVATEHMQIVVVVLVVVVQDTHADVLPRPCSLQYRLMV